MIEFKHELLDDRVLILPDPTEQQTGSGVYIPQSAQRREKKGTVIAVGKGSVAPDTGLLIEMWVKKNDRVILENSGWEDCGFDGFQGYIIGRQSSIKCIIKN